MLILSIIVASIIPIPIDRAFFWMIFESFTLVIEVNSNPGFKELERSTGVNIASSIVDYAVEYAEKHKIHMV